MRCDLQTSSGCACHLEQLNAQSPFLFSIVFGINYRKRGSASYIVREVLSMREREREREIQTERDGSDVTIVALKLAMNLHFPLPKIRTFRFSLHTSRLYLVPSRRGHHCGAEIRNEFTLSIAKKCFALFVPPLSNGTSRATSDRKPKTNDQILPSPVLFFPSKK